MELMTFRSTSGHRFTALPVQTVEVITASDTENISPGQLVHDQEGNPFTVLEVRHVLDRMWKVVMLPDLAP